MFKGVPMGTGFLPTTATTLRQNNTDESEVNYDVSGIGTANNNNIAQSSSQVNHFTPQSQSVAPMPMMVEQPTSIPRLDSNRVAGIVPASGQAWQSLHTLLFAGPATTQQSIDPTLVAAPIVDNGPYSKYAPPTMILTTPYVANIREVLLKRKLTAASSSSSDGRKRGTSDKKSNNGTTVAMDYNNDEHEHENLALLHLQRHVRAQLIEEFTQRTAKGTPGGTSTEFLGRIAGQQQLLLSNRRNHTRIKRTDDKVRKQYEKELRYRRSNWRAKSKQKQLEMQKNLLEHRERFISYHRFVRNTARALSIAVVDNAGIFNSKSRFGTDALEERRLKALRENDMDGYAALVNDTKNDRLKFLMEETDSCVTTINKLIFKQSRKITGEDDRGNDAKNNEIVQPAMLRGGDLKGYQLEGLKWLVSLYENNLNGILADDMGLGKTIQTIALLAYLMEFKRNNGPFLIVVPLSTLSNWKNECAKWAPAMLCVTYKGHPNIRKQIVKDSVETRQFNVLLTTYEYIMKDVKSLKKVDWQYIIVDEGHRMKNADSKFAQTLGTLYTSKHRLLLTGTPLQNNLPELWALLNFLVPTVFNSIESFDQWFNKPFAQFREKGNINEDEAQSILTREERMLIVHRLHEVLRPFMLRRVKDQVLDQLPEKRESIIRCRLSGWQRKLYAAICTKSIAGTKELQSDGSSINVQGINNPIMHMRKVCNHPYLFLNDWTIDEDIVRASGKFELLDRMLPKLAAAGHRVLIFTQMTQCMTIMETFFDMRGIMHLRLDGSTTADDREKRMHMFNDPDSPYFVFLLSTRAGGLGLNLATADTVIIFDSDWNPMMDLQAQDRAHRIGQKNEVRVFRLISNNSVEDRILARANDKKSLIELTVEAGLVNRPSADEETAGNSAKEMMESLLSEWVNGGAAAAELDEWGDESDIVDDEQINELMAIYEGEYELYQQMDLQRAQIVAQAWKDKNKLEGRIGLKCPPLPPPLFDKDEQPTWLSPESWIQKHSGITQAMMSANNHTLHSSDGFGYDAYGSALTASRGGDAQRPSSVVVEPILTGGKVLRHKKEVFYDDGLTEDQYARLLEQDENVKEECIQIAKRAKQDAKSEAIDIASRKLTPIRERIMLEASGLINLIIRLKRSNGQSLCEWFKEKPNKEVFRDYYALIEKAISLKEINSGLKNGFYKSIEAVEEDLALMSRNARTYNLDGSEVLKVCEDIRSAFYEGMAVIRDKFGLPRRTMPQLAYGIAHIYSDEELEAAEAQLDRIITEKEAEMAIKITLNKKRI